MRKPETATKDFAMLYTSSPSRDEVVKALETARDLYIVSENPETAFRNFASQFTPVEAAGGVVEQNGKRLVIFRNGRWDLPKGHLESGETLPECAAREVSEECGLALNKITVGRHITDTVHFYYFPKTARWEIKTTHWYLMNYSGEAQLKPQTEEGIERVVWLTPEESLQKAALTFGTIRKVLETI